MKTILVVDESSLFRDFLKKKFEEYGFDVTAAVNGLDASTKLRQIVPDLFIMDYYLSRFSSVELLEKKNGDPNTKGIPVIMVSAKIDRDKILQVARYGVRKFFTKPVKVDALLEAVGETLKVKLDLDNTPCIIEAHVNDEILFIEVSQGLNKEKIELLRYKIQELIELYELKNPRVLILMSNIDIKAGDSLKFGVLLNTVLETTRAKPRFIKVLTNSKYVSEFVSERSDYSEIEVTNNLSTAMDGLLGKRAGELMSDDGGVVQSEFLQGGAGPRKASTGESVDLRFHSERNTADELSSMEKGVRIAVVDDDFVIRELINAAFSDTKFEIMEFENGRLFVDSGGAEGFDLVFLDLMMPEMDGFEVLKHLHETESTTPVIILSALSKKETVVEALRYGVKSYMIKPLKPDWIQKKAAEVLRLNF